MGSILTMRRLADHTASAAVIPSSSAANTQAATPGGSALSIKCCRELPQRHGACDAGCHSGGDREQALPQQCRTQAIRRCPDGQPHADLVGALGDGIRRHAVDADHRQQDREDSEEQHRAGVESRLRQSILEPLVQRLHGHRRPHPGRRCASHRAPTPSREPGRRVPSPAGSEIPVRVVARAEKSAAGCQIAIPGRPPVSSPQSLRSSAASCRKKAAFAGRLTNLRARWRARIPDSRWPPLANCSGPRR